MTAADQNLKSSKKHHMLLMKMPLKKHKTKSNKDKKLLNKKTTRLELKIYFSNSTNY